MLEEANRLISAQTRRPRDRRKIDEYLDAVRDVERRLQKAEEQKVRSCRSLEQPAAVPAHV